MKFPKHKERRPFDEARLPGYLESDNDYVENNMGLALALLKAFAAGQLTHTVKSKKIIIKSNQDN